eukprot:5864469-Pyramimonas_sp.AAC.2
MNTFTQAWSTHQEWENNPKGVLDKKIADIRGEFRHSSGCLCPPSSPSSFAVAFASSFPSPPILGEAKGMKGRGKGGGGGGEGRRGFRHRRKPRREGREERARREGGSSSSSSCSSSS